MVTAWYLLLSRIITNIARSKYNHTMDVTQIKSGIYYVGVNDRTKHRFEGLWPLPQGVSYNSYLAVDEKVALIDTVDAAYTDIFLDSVRRRLGDRPIDYLVVNHMEPDHSASLRAVLGLYPDMTVVGNRQTVKMLEGYFGNVRTLEVSDRQTLSLGRKTLAFYLTPMIHWPETMVTLAARGQGALYRRHIRNFRSAGRRYNRLATRFRALSGRDAPLLLQYCGQVRKCRATFFPENRGAGFRYGLSGARPCMAKPDRQCGGDV